MNPVDSPATGPHADAQARLTVLGESLVDLIRTERGHCTEHVGGSPLNVAVGCARLGMTATLATHYGEDAHGRLIAAHLAANGVETINGGTGPTSTATALLGANGSATYAFSLFWDIADAALAVMASIEEADHVHAGSIGAMLPPGDGTVYSLVQAARATATISYDPNCRPGITPDRALARSRAELFVAGSDIVKASDEDLLWLYPDRPLEQTMAAWLEAGPALVVVTRGPLGPLAMTRDARAEVRAPALTVADTVGAGDSFMAALISGLSQLGLLGAANREELRRLDQGHLAALCRYAAAAAAVTCSRPGADPPRSVELQPLAAQTAAAGGPTLLPEE